MEAKPKRIQTFVSANGKAPFEEWFSRISDQTIKARIATRIDRLRLGNFRDCKSVGMGVFELRIHAGPGYRIYFGLVGVEVVLLLGGGSKSDQRKDILLSYRNWKEFNSGKT